ncbi:MAG: hypothetical protein LUG23_07250 [Oscillospiraceae bacterium]|nr:hypothetical protein [Oscillospiraceae bacterium]
MSFYFNRFNCLQLFNGLVFYAPVALLVRTQAGMTVSQFLLLQAVLSIVIFAGEVPARMVTDRIGYKKLDSPVATASSLGKSLPDGGISHEEPSPVRP